MMRTAASTTDESIDASSAHSSQSRERDGCSANDERHSGHYDYDYDEDDDEDDDEDSVSLREIVAGAWKQHAVAVLVAFLATVAHHCYRHRSAAAAPADGDGRFAVPSPFRGTDRTPVDHSRGPPSATLAPSNHNRDGRGGAVVAHKHLEGYRRMDSVSFCPHHSRIVPSDPHLRTLEFYLPFELHDTVRVLYRADRLEDDFYQFLDRYSEDTVALNKDTVALTKDDNDEEDNDDKDARAIRTQLQCLTQQRQASVANTRKTKFRGTSHYYQTPSLESIHRLPEFLTDDADADATDIDAVARQNSVADPRKRRRKLEQPRLAFTGFAAKFVNLSPNPVILHWDGHGGLENNPKLVGEIAPFESIGTATKPGHSFFVTPVYDSRHALERWVVTEDAALNYYQPSFDQHRYFGSDANRNHDQRRMQLQYNLQLLNQAYARDYQILSRRTWLGNFPRKPPAFHIHDAAYIGQVHSVGSSDSNGRAYRMEVLSVAPRVLQIDDFLTADECEQIIASAKQEGLHPSTLFGGGGGGTIAPHQTRDTSTRSSTNAWLPRELSPVTESIYERAAAVMNLDPDLLAKYSDHNPRHHSIAEALQVVHYKKGGEEYQPHHDFVVPPVTHRYQPTRFATMLLYLNTVHGDGGETVFPRAVTRDKAEGISIKPRQGRAVLFYNMLPDGNVDDLSQHGSNPTNHHEEKWLANLWVWDPIID